MISRVYFILSVRNSCTLESKETIRVNVYVYVCVLSLREDALYYN